MDASDTFQLIILIILLILSAFFSSNETALMAVNKIRLRSLADEGNKRAAMVLDITENHTQKMLSAILIGNNIVNIAAASIGTILGCFQEKFPGKIQQGSAWWFNDHKTGMTEQMTSLGNLGCLGNFIGMLTDSRSFLSYTRHEYFRRIMCELIGGWVDNGEYPADMKSLETIVKGICYNNAVNYFGFDLKTVE